jgi:hypothetical protein
MAALTDTPTRKLTWGPKSLPVPYAAAWTGETGTARALTVRRDGTGLCYRDEKPQDRDQHGVLWARMRQAPGDGRPKFGGMHPVRQWRAMRALLCQVCGGPASRTSRGWLFLIPGSGSPSETDEVEGSLCTKPPICEPCAELALRHCPHLTGPVAVRSRRPRVWGVLGDQYAPAGPSGGIAHIPTDGYMPYGHARAARWFIASQLVLELTRCTRAHAATASASPTSRSRGVTPGKVDHGRMESGRGRDVGDRYV